ncbi:hypothetical protein SBV1_2630018 [Verrucomicrobia bacterium]|nr:hypothetical protein SBV1_2630018 [Verrucomicrobiota bacterium]
MSPEEMKGAASGQNAAGKVGKINVTSSNLIGVDPIDKANQTSRSARRQGRIAAFTHRAPIHSWQNQRHDLIKVFELAAATEQGQDRGEPTL